MFRNGLTARGISQVVERGDMARACGAELNTHCEIIRPALQLASTAIIDVPEWVDRPRYYPSRRTCRHGSSMWSCTEHSQYHADAEVRGVMKAMQIQDTDNYDSLKSALFKAFRVHTVQLPKNFSGVLLILLMADISELQIVPNRGDTRINAQSAWETNKRLRYEGPIRWRVRRPVRNGGDQPQVDHPE
ncbi:hypothetical protein T02_864 [Trichinella nativa]|uniref:Uncharacterized protein n=1 Tax=Trichinella nativa TaxID=6335 RepID=A0A0V1LL68_9BILA|nr:hypothetical protein T02_864 [Trichinella nativa]